MATKLDVLSLWWYTSALHIGRLPAVHVIWQPGPVAELAISAALGLIHVIIARAAVLIITPVLTTALAPF